MFRVGGCGSSPNFLMMSNRTHPCWAQRAYILSVIDTCHQQQRRPPSYSAPACGEPGFKFDSSPSPLVPSLGTLLRYVIESFLPTCPTFFICSLRVLHRIFYTRQTRVPCSRCAKNGSRTSLERVSRRCRPGRGVIRSQ